MKHVQRVTRRVPATAEAFDNLAALVSLLLNVEALLGVDFSAILGKDE